LRCSSSALILLFLGLDSGLDVEGLAGSEGRGGDNGSCMSFIVEEMKACHDQKRRKKKLLRE
jgi:hypothetical protein